MFDGTTIVVTRHLPATPLIDSHYKNDVLNPAFASRLEDVLEQYQPDLWIHGHPHVPCDYAILGTNQQHGYCLKSGGRILIRVSV